MEFFDQHATHVFHFFYGDQNRSFLSSHMVMASAFALALILLHPRTGPLLTTLLCQGAILLVIGDWHFLGDVAAGSFVGGSARFVAGELWCQHMRLHGPHSDIQKTNEAD